MYFQFFALLSLYIGATMAPQYSIQKVSIDLQSNDQGDSFYMYKGKPVIVNDITPIASATLTKASIQLAQKNGTNLPKSEFVSETKIINGQPTELIYQLKLAKHLASGHYYQLLLL